MSNEHGTLSALAQKALAVLSEKQQHKEMKVKVKSLDCELTLRAMTAEEWDRIVSLPNMTMLKRVDKVVYLCCKELQQIANELGNAGKLMDYEQVCDVMPPKDRVEISNRILDLSGITGDSDLVFSDETNALKN